MFTSETTFDEMRKALIEKNIALNCGYESNKKIDYEYLFDKWSQLPKASRLSNEVDNYQDLAVELNLNFTFLIDAFLSAFANLSLASRIRYGMILLYCADPKRCLENDQLDLDTLGFLYAANMVELPNDGISKGMIITTKEGIHFLHRFFLSKDLKAEFK